MLGEVREVTMCVCVCVYIYIYIYIPTTALQLDTILYKRVIMLLHVSAFFGHPQGRYSTKKRIIMATYVIDVQEYRCNTNNKLCKRIPKRNAMCITTAII